MATDLWRQLLTLAKPDGRVYRLLADLRESGAVVEDSSGTIRLVGGRVRDSLELTACQGCILSLLAELSARYEQRELQGEAQYALQM